VAIDLSQRIISPRLGVHKHAVDALDHVKILLQGAVTSSIFISLCPIRGRLRAGASVASRHSVANSVLRFDATGGGHDRAFP
jgi:hypothetical protein